jgi:signal transduction histidine kinase
MDLSKKDKIFALFKRLHDHVEGSGIGLYIVKKIIEKAGGKIEVDSKLDQGSVFRVYFKQ